MPMRTRCIGVKTHEVHQKNRPAWTRGLRWLPARDEQEQSLLKKKGTIRHISQTSQNTGKNDTSILVAVAAAATVDDAAAATSPVVAEKGWACDYKKEFQLVCRAHAQSEGLPEPSLPLIQPAGVVNSGHRSGMARRFRNTNAWHHMGFRQSAKKMIGAHTRPLKSHHCGKDNALRRSTN